ncbi:MAG TPA: hypothetical protein VK402_20315 [Blastococcus sp.]|nr:hypothetical protein [Blastococcus sp.]
MANSILQIAAMTAVLVAVFGGTGPLLRAIGRLLDRRHRARHPESTRRPLQVVAADVRRLGRQIALVPAGAPMARRRALAAAYDDVLVEAAELLDVPHDLTAAPLGAERDLERLRLLAALEEAGLAVRG